MSQHAMKLPPGQQLAAVDKWPAVGERVPRSDSRPWTVEIAGLVERPRVWSLDELAALPQIEATVDVHCVTRWSKPGMRFRGVLLQSLLEAVVPQIDARFVSFAARSERGHSTSLPLVEAVELGTLVAVAAEGRILESEHGGPIRTVVPGRYFYKSLKWLERIELLADDRLGYWEAETGYHNTGDPWREQRYMAPALSRAEMRAALESRDFRGRDLRSIVAAGHNLRGLKAAESLLRDADFRNADLQAADFRGANLSNAHFEKADLRGTVFAGSDCEGANFCGADLRGADFSEASLFGASLAEFDERGQAAVAALIDSATRIDPQSLVQLTPQQAVWVAAEVARSTDREGRL